MISWIEGKRIDNWNYGTKKGVVLSCAGIGYEVQLLPRYQSQVKDLENINLWIHQVYREDGITMFGFKERIERDLFRKLIEVNGIGPQIGISLLEESTYKELLLDIKNESIDKLTKASGVGRRIAERITIELRGKLSEFFEENNISTEKENNELKGMKIIDSLQVEVINILKNLDYNDSQINEALKAVEKELSYENVRNKNHLGNNEQALDSYLKKMLVWLSQEVSSKGT
tara:strand:- start:311 stop:1000 length:690 start_codon:yes stop_codon:yes gene_type:complete